MGLVLHWFLPTNGEGGAERATWPRADHHTLEFAT